MVHCYARVYIYQIFDEGLYYVKRIDSNNLKFAKSQSRYKWEQFCKSTNT